MPRVQAAAHVAHRKTFCASAMFAGVHLSPGVDKRVQKKKRVNPSGDGVVAPADDSVVVSASALVAGAVVQVGNI